MPGDDLFRVTFELDLNQIKDIIENGSFSAVSILLHMCSDNSLRGKLADAKHRTMLNVEFRFIPFVP